RVLVLGGAHQLALGGDELDGDEAVARQAVRALEPARAAAERQPRDAGRRDPPAGRGQAVLLRRLVELAPRQARARARDALLRVDGDLLAPPHVDDPA